MPSTRTTSRALVLITFLAFVSIGFPDAVLGVAWPLMRQTFERDLSNLGYILVASGSGYFISSAFSGRAILRLGVGRILAISTTLVTIGLFTFAVTPSFWSLLLAGFVIGLGSGTVDAGLNFYASEHFSVTVMNWLHAFFGIGAMVGPFIMASVFAAGGGWRLGYLIVASAIGVMGVIFILTIQRWNNGTDDATADTAPPISVRRILGMPTVWLQIAIFFVMCGIEASAGSWTATIMAGKFDASESLAGLWTGIFWGAMAVGRIFGVPLSRDLSPARLVQICTWGLLAGSLLMTRDQVWLFQGGLIVFGLAMAPMFPTLMSLTPVRFTSQVSLHTIGFQVSAATIGIVTISTLGGVVAQRTTLTAIPWIMVACSVIIIGMDMALRTRTDNVVASGNQPKATTHA